MAYSEEVKNEAKEMLAKGKKVKQVSEEMKISVATIYKWKKEVEEKTVEKIEERYLKSQSNKPIQDAIDTSKEIKKLIGLKRFNEAMRLTEKYLENPVIQSQRVKILIINRKYQEAKRIGRREEFINDAPIQSQMITIVIKEGDLEEAKRIGRREEFINNMPTQSQMITLAIKEGDLEEAKRIGRREEFINNAPIQSQMITIAIKEGDLEKAKKIGKRKEFINNEQIQSQMITIAIKEGDLEKAKKIGRRKEFINSESIQSQMITIAIKEGDLEEAKRIGRREEFINNEQIQSQMITIAIKEGDLEKAKKIGKRKEFINSESIQSQMITIAIKEGNLEEAIETRIIETMKPIKYEMFEEQTSTLNSEILNQIATKLYYNKIEQKDIERIINYTEMSEFERDIMLLAIYEKQKNISKAKQLVKKYRDEDNQSEHNKIFNKIIQRIQSKKTQIFDYEFYDDLLHWKIDKELKEKYEQEQKSEIQKGENFKPKAIILARKSENSQERIKTQTRGDYKRTEGNKKSFKESIKVKQDNIIVQKKEKKELYFSQISNFLKEKRHLIYLKMQSTNPQIQRTGIEQWDKMEALIEKVKENKDNKDYLNILYQKISELKEKENRMSSR